MLLRQLLTILLIFQFANKRDIRELHFKATINTQMLKRIATIILLLVIVLSIAPKTIDLFTKWANVDVAPHINAGPTFPKDYEYEAALWIKENTPPNTVIISDPVSIEILSGLADRVRIAQITMGHLARKENITRLKLIYKILTAESDSEIYQLLDTLKNMGITTEQFYQSFYPVRYPSFIILVSQRTSLWLDVEMRYPIIYFNERPVNMKYISNFLNSDLFELLYKVEGKIYIFKPLGDFFWNAADYSMDVVEKVEGCVFHISFDDKQMMEQVTLNITKVEWRMGSAAYFNGFDSYVFIPYLDELNIREAITLEAWIRPELEMPTEHVWNIIVAKGSPAKYLLFYNNQIKKIGMGVRIGDKWYWVEVPFTLDGKWHHLVGTYAPGDYRLYLDGQLVLRRTDVSGFLDTDELPLTVGTLYDFMQCIRKTKWKGAIDEIRIYNRVLSEQEILNHYELKFHKVAKLGEVKIPFKVPCESKVEIKVLAAISDMCARQNITAFKLMIYDRENKSIVYRKEIKASDFNTPNTYQLISVGITDAILNPDRNYMIQISSTHNFDVFVDYVIGQIIYGGC